MTICIAAICQVTLEGGPIAVGAADRMITIRDIEFEPDQTKVLWLASHTAILLAGEMRLHAIAAPATLERTKKLPPSDLTVENIAEIYAEEFQKFVQDHAEREILAPLKLTYDSFIERQGTMSRDFVLETKRQLQEYGIDAEAIIVGMDPSGPHIFKIINPGLIVCCDTESFAASGTGQGHAESQFMLAGFHRRWAFVHTLILAYGAKARAEANTGVGKKTDLLYISAAGGTPVLPEEMDKLNAIYRRKMKRDAHSEGLAARELQAYIAERAEAISQPHAPQAQTAGDDGIPVQPASAASSAKGQT